MRPWPSTPRAVLRPPAALTSATDAKRRCSTALEHLCRYVCRPPIAQERLEETASGKLRYSLKRPWRDGTVALVLVLEPLDLLARVCALIPPPRFHMIRYHGVLSSHDKARVEVVPHVEELPVHDELRGMLAPLSPTVALDRREVLDAIGTRRGAGGAVTSKLPPRDRPPRYGSGLRAKRADPMAGDALGLARWEGHPPPRKE